METRFIYILTRDNIPIYVGKTKNPKQRVFSHRLTKGDDINLEVIDEIPIAEWKFWERHYISLYRSWGFKLLNKKLHAGNGSDIMSKETRQKMSKPRTNIWKLSDKTKLKMSNYHKTLTGEKHNIYGTITVNNGIIIKRVKKDKLQEYLDKGWIKGLTQSIKDKSSNSRKGKTPWNKKYNSKEEKNLISNQRRRDKYKNNKEYREHAKTRSNKYYHS